MDAQNLAITRRACIGMMMGTLLGCSGRGLTRATSQPEIAITMDDLDANADDTPRLSLDQRNAAILAALKSARVRAAMFVTGMRVDNPRGKQHVAQWSEAGHILGNHSYSHWNYARAANFQEYFADILRNQTLLEPYPGFRKWFRFPYLKEGATAEQRDRMRTFLKQHGYQMGYVTVDTSDWAIDARLRKRLGQDPQASLDRYRDFYLAHLWDRTQFYDRLAWQVLKRQIRHTVLIHHNLLNALFLPDVLQMYAQRGWRVIDADAAFQDPVFTALPNVVPPGESIVWALAKESGAIDVELRYPAEDEPYIRREMDERGL